MNRPLRRDPEPAPETSPPEPDIGTENDESFDQPDESVLGGTYA